QELAGDVQTQREDARTLRGVHGDRVAQQVLDPGGVLAAEGLVALVLGKRGLPDVAHQVAGELEVRRGQELDVVRVDARTELELALLEPFEAVPHVAVLGAERGVGLDALPELALPADLAADEHGVLEAGELPAVRLEAVLDAEELVPDLALRLGALTRDRLKDVTLPAQPHE